MENLSSSTLPLMQFKLLYKVVLKFISVDEILMFDHSNSESFEQ